MFRARAYHFVALFNARFAKSVTASLFTRTFCIAREFLRMSFSFGFSFGDDRVDLVLPGVDGDDGAGAVLPVSGDIFFPDLDDALIVTMPASPVARLMPGTSKGMRRWSRCACRHAYPSPTC